MATFNLMSLNFLAPAQTAFLSCRCSEPHHLSGMLFSHLPLKVHTHRRAPACSLWILLLKLETEDLHHYSRTLHPVYRSSSKS